MGIKAYVDWSNICHMCYSVASKNYEENCERQVFDYTLVEIFHYNLASKIRHLSNTILEAGYVDAEFVFVKDEDSRRKIMLYPNYKIHRSERVIPMEDAIEHIYQKGYGDFCYSPDNEADDAIATLVTQNDGIIISADKDLWQLLRDNVPILNPMTKLFITLADIDKAFNLQTPSHIALYKSLWGDAGDGVPNAVPRMQRHLLPLVRATDGTLDSLKAEIKSAWWGLSRRCRDLYAENERQVAINWELVKLDTSCEIVWDLR